MTFHIWHFHISLDSIKQKSILIWQIYKNQTKMQNFSISTTPKGHAKCQINLSLIGSAVLMFIVYKPNQIYKYLFI